MKKTISAVLIMAFVTFILFSQSGGMPAECYEDTVNKDVQLTLDNYFAFRKTQFFGSELRRESIEMSQDVYHDACLRQQALKEMQEWNGFVFVSADVQYQILKIERLTDRLILTVKEVSVLGYQYPNLTTIDELSFSTLHTISYRNDRGHSSIVLDTFDESLSTHFQSSDYQDNHEETMGEMKEIVNASQEMGALSRSNIDTSSYNPTTAIAYSNTWVNSYNPSYISYQKDCANYVSQCLHEGGVPYSSQVPGPGNEWRPYENPWINVGGFDNFMPSHGMTKYSFTSSSYNKAGPGNPVYWLNPPGSSSSGHLMFCVGYNGAGIPVYNAHNEGDDIGVSHMPVTHAFLNSSTLYTFEFTHVYEYSDVGSNSYHEVQCALCGYSFTQAHNWVYYQDYYASSNSIEEIEYFRGIPYYICTLCGRTVPFYYIE